MACDAGLPSVTFLPSAKHAGIKVLSVLADINVSTLNQRISSCHTFIYQNCIIIVLGEPLDVVDKVLLMAIMNCFAITKIKGKLASCSGGESYHKYNIPHLFLVTSSDKPALKKVR